jgi:hypothetical protein
VEAVGAEVNGSKECGGLVLLVHGIIVRYGLYF